MHKINIPFSSNEKNFISEAFQSNLRIDGRNKTDYRQISLNIFSFSALEFYLGNTKALVNIYSEIIDDFDVRDLLSLTFDFSSALTYNNKRRDYTEISRLVEKTILSRMVNTESLIISNSKAYRITISGQLLIDDGNVTDCLIMAIASGIKLYRYPSISIQQDINNINISQNFNELIPLSVNHLPISITFGYYNYIDNSNQPNRALIIDPTYKEELVITSQVTMVINEYCEICNLYKLGGESISQELLLNMVTFANNQYSTLSNIIKSSIDDYINSVQKKEQNELCENTVMVSL